MRVSRFIRGTSSFLLPPPTRSELEISVGTAGPHPQAADVSGHCRTSSPAPDVSGHCRTSTASAISVGTAGPQRRAPDVSGHCRASTASARSQWAQKECQNKCKIDPNRMPERMSAKLICQKDSESMSK